MTPLKYVASVRVSSVDKKSVEGQSPIRLCNYTDVYYRDTILSDQEFMFATATSEQIDTFRLRPGDVIITKDSETPDDIGVPAYVADSAPDLICGYHLAMIRPDTDRLHARYLYWAMNSKSVRSQLSISATGITRFGLRTNAIKRLDIPLPPLDEQCHIADFLDSMDQSVMTTTKIRRRLDNLLGQRTNSLRNKYFDVDGPIARLKWYVTAIAQGASPQAEDRMAGPDEWAVLKLNAIQHGHFSPGEHKALPAPPGGPKLVPKKGDLLVTRSNTPGLVGDCCVVERAQTRVLLPDLIYRVQVHPMHLLPRYVMHFLLSPLGRSQLEAAARGTSQSMVKLRGADLLDVKLPVPPIEHQARVINDLDTKLDHTKELVSKLKALESRLRERHHALITAAVAGELPPSYRASLVAA